MNGIYKNTVLISGSNSILGKELKLHFSKKINVIFLPKKVFNITNYKNILEICNIYKPKIIINTAAYTNTEKANSQRKLAYKINVKGVENLSKISSKLKIKFIHFSSDYVFDGKTKKPYKENDFTKPINYYGKTKLMSEKKILKYNKKNSMIIRTSMLYSLFNRNILTLLLKILKKKNDLNFVDDVVCSPTSASNLAKFLNYVILNDKFKPGIFNFCDSGYCSNYEFACYVLDQSIKLRIIKKTNVINPILYKNYKSKILRPKFSSLNNNKTAYKFNFKFFDWKNNVTKMLKKSIN